MTPFLSYGWIDIDIVTVAAQRVHRLLEYNAWRRLRHSPIAFSMMRWSMPFRTYSKSCFSSSMLNI